MADPPDPTTAILAAIRHGPRLTRLAKFATRRHGYADTDGGFGVTYPGDLDDYDREVDGFSIPEGYVEVMGFWGLPEGYELFVPETYYLTVLTEALREAGLKKEADEIRTFLASQPPL